MKEKENAQRIVRNAAIFAVIGLALLGIVSLAHSAPAGF
jgi:hypothetical protein